MAKQDKEKVMLAEHVLEVRHAASGSFLNVVGYVADYIREKGIFPHWKIDINIVNFRDEADSIKQEGAFVGYKSAGYVVYNPPTRNYFAERATSFWRTLLKNNHYTIPMITRFGARTKVFIPIKKSFEEINTCLFNNFFTEQARSVIGGKESDVQFVIEIVEDEFDVRVSGGPIHKGEVGKYLNFQSAEFKKNGIFLDLDYSRTKKLTISNIPKLLSRASELTWIKAERIVSSLGF